MTLKSLSKSDLMMRFGQLVQTERKITHLILECINEIELRRVHLEIGYASLFDLLTLKYGYSPASAQRRIDGARLLRQVPALADKIEKGDLNLTQVSVIQKSLKQAEKEHSNKYTQEQKQILIEKVALSKMNIEETQVMLAQELNLSLPTEPQKIQHHRDSSVSVTFHFTQEEIEQLNQVRDLLSNSTSSLDLKKTLVYLAQRELKKYNKKSTGSESTSVTEVKIQNKAISTKTKRSLIKPGACCEYVDPHTQTKCSSKSFLNIDHIQPKWAGENNERENLRVLCKNHNIYRYQVQAGIRAG